VDESPASSSTGGGRKPDPTAQTTRRLDWRFLLPDPDLQRVIYFGPGSDRLLESLQRFAASVEVGGSPAPENCPHAPESFDLTVLQGDCHRSVERARLLLRAEGMLYWELERTPLIPSRQGRRTGESTLDRLQTRHRYRSLLQSHGFGDVRTYWHHPNFEECRQIIPAGEPHLLTYRLSQAGGSRSRLAARTLGWLACRTGLIGHLAPTISVIAQKNAGKRTIR
jgi:hypothetical protein